MIKCSDTNTINCFENDYFGRILPETPDEKQQIAQDILDLLTRICSTRSPLPQDDELLPEINQLNKRETITINDDSDIDFNISRTINGVEIGDIKIVETDKNIKQEDIFDRIINQLPPDNDTVYIDHVKEKIRVRMETSNKNITQKPFKRKSSKCYLYSWKKKDKKTPKKSSENYS